jgi:hypothetical protein
VIREPPINRQTEGIGKNLVLHCHAIRIYPLQLISITVHPSNLTLIETCNSEGATEIQGDREGEKAKMNTLPIVLGVLILAIVLIGVASLINISNRKEGPEVVGA